MINWLLNLFRKSPMTPSETPPMKTISRPGWNFRVLVKGDDLVVENCTATWFGGGNDSLDNGETASGVMNDGRNPNLLGCALPVAWYHPSTAGSPFIKIPHPTAKRPSIPWHTPVIVTHEGQSITCPLIDNGPAKSAQDAIDITVAAFKALGVPLKRGVIKVSFRVVGGAKYLA